MSFVWTGWENLCAVARLEDASPGMLWFVAVVPRDITGMFYILEFCEQNFSEAADYLGEGFIKGAVNYLKENQWTDPHFAHYLRRG